MGYLDNVLVYLMKPGWCFFTEKHYPICEQNWTSFKEEERDMAAEKEKTSISSTKIEYDCNFSNENVIKFWLSVSPESRDTDKTFLP